MKNFTIYSALCHHWHPLDVFFPNAVCVVAKSPDDLKAPGILIIHGGADISPSLYNKPVSSRTHATEKPTNWDLIEQALIQRAMQLGITVFGICRGAQLMCAVAGGYLIQDVTNHHGKHTVKTNTGDVLHVNSIHHQMMAPWQVDHELLAWSEHPRSKHYDDAGVMVNVPCEPEAVWYPNMGLAIQWHPEMMDENTNANQWIKTVLEKKLDF